MVHLDLFSGIGGFALACQWAGIETIGFVEIDKYCQKALRKHWPNVPIVEDVRDVKAIKKIVDDSASRAMRDDRQNQRAIPRDVNPSPSPSLLRGAEAITEVVANTPVNRRTRNGVAWDREYGLTDSSSISKQCWWQGKHSECQERWCNCACHDDKPAILITAGFPCQPFSVAGKRGSTEDDRYLWPQTLAVIEAIKPEWVLLENVTGIINLAIDQVLSDLEGSGYAHAALGQDNRRERGIMAGTEREGRGCDSTIESCSEDVANTANRLPQPRGTQRNVGRLQGEVLRTGWDPDYWAVEPELGRVANGIPHRVDRLKCLGNAIVPQVAYEIIKVIVDIETK